MPLRVYLDTSVYNRPFDDQTQPRIWLESLALSVILQLIETGEIELVVSTVIGYETSRNPHVERRLWVQQLLGRAIDNVSMTPAIRERAEALERGGLKALDALHLACAERDADVFVTCDDRLIRRYERRADHTLRTIDPVGFVRALSENQGEDAK